MGVRSEMPRIADLAQLRLSDAELDAIARYIEAAIGSLTPANGAGLDEVRREAHESSCGERGDAPSADPLLEPIERLAPAWRAGFFTVPKQTDG